MVDRRAFAALGEYFTPTGLNVRCMDSGSSRRRGPRRSTSQCAHWRTQALSHRASRQACALGLRRRRRDARGVDAGVRLGREAVAHLELVPIRAAGAVGAAGIRPRPATTSDALRVLDEADTLAVARATSATPRRCFVTTPRPSATLEVSRPGIRAKTSPASAGWRSRTRARRHRWAEGADDLSSIRAGRRAASVDAVLPGRRNAVGRQARARWSGRTAMWIRAGGSCSTPPTAACRRSRSRCPASARRCSRMQPIECRRARRADHPGLSDAGPAGNKSTPRPAVIVIHGGPNVRDQRGWSEDVQLFARAGGWCCAAVPRRPAARPSLRGSRLPPVGTGDAGRHHRWRSLPDRVGHRRSEADLHLRGQLRRLRGDVGVIKTPDLYLLRGRPGRISDPRTG